MSVQWDSINAWTTDVVHAPFSEEKWLWVSFPAQKLVHSTIIQAQPVFGCHMVDHLDQGLKEQQLRKTLMEKQEILLSKKTNKQKDSSYVRQTRIENTLNQNQF